VTTFENLGLNFPLFAASVQEAARYRGPSTCVLCRSAHPHCFEVDDLILPCPACGTLTALSADDAEDTSCTSCDTTVSFPGTSETDEAVVCTPCLRAGRAAFTQNTELGMVRWEDAQRGRTHGLPGSVPTGFAVITDADGWHQVYVPSEVLLELVRTPRYRTLQGENWLFCHGRVMTYLGTWQRADFERAAPDGNGRDLFTRMIEDADPSLWEYADGGELMFYAFRCVACGTLRAHWDAT